jgi:putative acetyltransferase
MMTARLVDLAQVSEENSLVPMVEIRAFRPEDATAFRELNEAWIKKYFGMEEQDYVVLGDPERYVVGAGGYIYMAFLDGVAVGCCALLLEHDGVYEVAKMAVTEEIRGRGIGRKVLAHTIEQARAMGASMLTLVTSSKLANAIHLYEALGFQHVEAPAVLPYARGDVFMELSLEG